MYSDVTEFSTFVDRQDADDLTSWLLIGLESSDFEPFVLHLEPSATVQLYYGFQELSPRSKEHFKAATVQAAAEWSYPAYSPNTLKQLVLLAAYTRAARIIKVLRALILSEALEGIKSLKTDYGTNDAYSDTVQYIVGVIQGFAHLTEAKSLLKRLFYDENFDPRFGAQLFIGLCESAPANYPTYVTRFLELSEVRGVHYAMPPVVYELVRIVTLPGIVRGFRGIKNPQMKRRFLRSLLLCEGSPVRCEVGQSSTEDNEDVTAFLLSTNISGSASPRSTTRFTLPVDNLFSQGELWEFAAAPTTGLARPAQLYQNPLQGSVEQMDHIFNRQEALGLGTEL